MFLRNALFTLSVGGLVALSGCGGDEEKSSESSEAKVTPQQAVSEIGQVRDALGQAVAQVRSGDKKAAENTVSEAYLQHFEKVEGPLEERDHELNEELEEALSQELRVKIKSGSAKDVEVMVAEIERDLTTAEGKLR